MNPSRSSLFLRLGQARLQLDAGVAALAAPLCQFSVFEQAGTADCVPRFELSVVRVPSLRNATPLDGRHPALGVFSLSKPDTLLAAIPESAESAEALVRAAYAICVERQGGLAVHAAGIVVNGHAAVALGPSGSGKSTLTRLCRAAGARVLSDETVACMPDGRVLGSPFSSETDLPSDFEQARLSMLLVLEKDSAEWMKEESPTTGARLLLGQAYRIPSQAEGDKHFLRRAAGLVQQLRVERLGFRKHPEAGTFLMKMLEQASDDVSYA